MKKFLFVLLFSFSSSCFSFETVVSEMYLKHLNKNVVINKIVSDVKRECECSGDADVRILDEVLYDKYIEILLHIEIKETPDHLSKSSTYHGQGITSIHHQHHIL